MATQTNKTAVIQIRINKQDKVDLEKTLDLLGLTTSQAVLLYFKQILLKQKIPLVLSLDKNTEEDNVNFKKAQAAIVAKLDEDEIIPEFNENNARPFVV